MLTIHQNQITLSIDSLHPEVIAYLEDASPQEKAQAAERALEVGVSVINRVTLSNDLDFVNKRLLETLNTVEDYFVGFKKTVESTLSSNLDPEEDGSFLSSTKNIINDHCYAISAELQTLIKCTQESLSRETQQLSEKQQQLNLRLDPNNKESYFSLIANQIEKFDGSLLSQFNEHDSSSFVSKLKTSIEDYFGEKGKALSLIEDKLKVDLTGQTPLGQVFVGLKSEIASLRDEIMKLEGQKELQDKTTLKGFSFEDKVFESLQMIAKPYADLVEDISLKAEVITESKKGDYLYTLAPSNINIVIDAKNYKKLKSLKAMLTLLDTAMKDRDAKIGIVVVPNKDSLQKQIGDWNCYDNNKIITSFEHLEISIKFAKSVSALQTHPHAEINISSVKSKLDVIQRKLKEMSIVKSKLTKLSNGVMESIIDIQSTLDAMKTEIENTFVELNQELTLL